MSGGGGAAVILTLYLQFPQLSGPPFGTGTLPSRTQDRLGLHVAGLPLFRLRERLASHCRFGCGSCSPQQQASEEHQDGARETLHLQAPPVVHAARAAYDLRSVFGRIAL